MFFKAITLIVRFIVNNIVERSIEVHYRVEPEFDELFSSF